VTTLAKLLARRIAARVQRQPGPAQALTDQAADLGRVLSDAAGKHDRLGALQDGQVGTDVLPDAVAEEVDRQRGLVVGPPEQLAHIGGSGQRHQARSPVQEPDDAFE